jgi:predicted metalloprotease with PDZ domain
LKRGPTAAVSLSFVEKKAAAVACTWGAALTFPSGAVELTTNWGSDDMKKLLTGAACALALFAIAAPADTVLAQPQGVPMPAPIAAPQDVAYPGIITLEVDVTDTRRGIWRGREIIPVNGAGTLTLLYPQWLPGKHAPRGPLNLFAGLEFYGNGDRLTWRRDPVNVYAFHIDVPAGVTEVEARYQYVSPTTSSQGRIVASENIVNLNWEFLILYPAGHYARQITYRPSITLPEGWQFAVALDGAQTEGQVTRFADVPLETLVDSPLFAGRYFRSIDLDPGAERPVRLNIVADHARALEASEEQIRPHRRLIDEAYRMFGSRHYDHYDFLFTLSDRIGGVGVEHQRSSENGLGADYFTDWSGTVSDRDLLPHELVHSWNGKFRRPADMWTPGYDVPMRGSLLWVYEGMTQYLGTVLNARSGLWTRDETLQSLALTAAAYEHRVGRQWRSVGDTTMDPIISARRPAPWSSWQRNEDYYYEGLLVWLEADAIIREGTGNRRSLDDFARAFFGVRNGEWEQPETYTFDDVAEALNRIHRYDWASFMRERFETAPTEPPLMGLERAGYRLVYREERSDFHSRSESSTASFMYSIGLSIGEGGNVNAVQWDGPAFQQGVTVSTQVVAVNDEAYSAAVMRRAITAAKDSEEPIRLLLKNGNQYRTVELDYHEGLRYPHLERIRGTPDRLSAILAPRAR